MNSLNLSIRKITLNVHFYVALILIAGMLSFVPSIQAEEPAKTGPTNLRIAQDESGNDLITHNTAQIAWDLIGDETNNNDIDIWNADTNAWVTWGDRGHQVIGGLKPETTYRVYITWYADRPSLDYKSNVIEFTTKADTSAYPEPPLVPPQHLRTTGISESGITLQWTGTPGANGYDVYVNGEWKQGVWDGSNTVTYAFPEGSSVTGAVYRFEVAAQNLPKTSANSNAVTITWGELAAPRDVQAVTATRTTVSLGWAETPGATGYDIYADGVLIGSSTEPRYVAEGLQEGHAYAFKVAAKNALWRSPDSAPVTVVPGADYNIISYYALWAASETGRNFKPSDVDVSQLTHINLAFSDLCWMGFGSGAAACQNASIPLQQDYVFDGEMIVGDPTADVALFSQWAAIRDANPHLKLMISVGGWSWSNHFSNMASTEETRRAFANSVVDFLRAYKLDGVDIDWEYPVEGGEDDNSRGPGDRDNFVLMAQTLRDTLDAAGSIDGKYYLSTIAAGQGDNFVANANLALSSRYLDFINVMTYDYSGSWDKLAHHNSPLYYDRLHPESYAMRNNVLGAVSSFASGGVPHYRLTVGIPFYGKGWIGCPPGGQYQTCAGATDFGTWENGIFDFTDIQRNYLTQDSFDAYWNDASKTAYLYNPDTGVFITYNDERTMMYTASLVKSQDLAGAMSWEISGDRNRTLTTRLAKDLPIAGIPDATALAAPTGVRAKAASTNSLDIQWDAVPRATAYEVYVGKAYAGTTSDTKLTLNGLAADTSYVVQVLAIEQQGSVLSEVSAFSSAITAKTTPASGPNTTYVPPYIPQAPKEGLETKKSQTGDKLSLTVITDAALRSIGSSAATAFLVAIEGEAKQAEVDVPKQITEAMASKAADATLIVRWDDVAFEIPVAALPSGADIRISIASADGQVSEAWKKLADDTGYASIGSPVSFNIESKQPDGSYDEWQSADLYLAHTFKVKATEVDRKHVAGVVFDPKTNAFHPVPVRFEEGSDGALIVKLLRQGNSVYGLLKTNVSIVDDLPDWARSDVELAASRLIVQGDTADSFGADRALTRAEVASLIVKALGILPDPSSLGSGFTDVDADSEYAADIAAATLAGLVTGRGGGIFDPSALVTREEMAVIIARALTYATGQEKPSDTAALERFSDRGAVSGYAKASVAHLVERGIMKGVSADKLAPKANVTKAQATVLAMKLLRKAGLLD